MLDWPINGSGLARDYSHGLDLIVNYLLGMVRFRGPRRL